jgi:hypothetical protein
MTATIDEPDRAEEQNRTYEQERPDEPPGKEDNTNDYSYSFDR